MNYQDLSTNLLGVASLRILLLTLISNGVIDFLSIRKVIIFSAIATEGRHHVRKTYCARHVMMFDALPVG